MLAVGQLHGDGVADCRDVCPHDPDDDADHDGICGDIDNCPQDSNHSQADVDGDGFGDACDAEECDGIDNTGEGQIDEGYPDTDSDGTADCVDPCPGDPLNDDDGDGICGLSDTCPLVADPSQTDSDGDGQGDACEATPLSGNWPTARADVAHSSHARGANALAGMSAQWEEYYAPIVPTVVSTRGWPVISLATFHRMAPSIGTARSRTAGTATPWRPRSS